MTSSQVETELKLRTDADEIEQLKASPWWRALEGATHKDLASTYFDTDENALRKLGLSLRTRNKDDAIEQTVKLSKSETASWQRGEWSALIPDAIPDPTLVIDPALPTKFRKLTAADLSPVFDVKVARDIRKLRTDAATIEIAVDEGFVESGNTQKELNEIELELIDGDAQELLAEARRIVDIAGGRLHLQSKADRGYQLKATQLSWSKAGSIDLSKKLDAGAALQTIILQCLMHLTANDECARTGAHIEGVHQCRVALRRLRSALRIFRDGTPREPFARLEREVKWLASTLGVARDFDVLRADLLEPAMAALDDEEHVAPLLDALTREQVRAYSDVADTLKSARYGRLLIDLFEVAIDDSWRARGNVKILKTPIRAYAARALKDPHKQLLKKGAQFKKLSPMERHALRISVKKMRYTAEFFSPLFKENRVKAFVGKLSGLQEGLGSLNDVVVAEDLLRKLVDAAQAHDDGEPGDLSYCSGCVLGWHRRRAADMNKGLNKEWKRFVSAEPFWRK